MAQKPGEPEETGFLEFRRKVRAAEILSAGMERLLAQLGFSGKLSVLVHNGRVLKSGYEEGYFRNPSDV
jgi:sulfur carrier protein ThiS